MITYKKLDVHGLQIFYREAGDASKPTILLLHGFPSSSHMYRDLIADLQDDFHLIAPDYPGFGFSSMPDKSEFSYTFDHIAQVMEQFIDQLGLKKFNLYVHDYGAPIGYRIASKRPELIQSLLIQNANAYLEGLGPNLAAIPPFWTNRNAETEEPIRGLLSLEGTKFQYLDGAENPENISPDAYYLDQYFLDRPGNSEIQLDLLFDYQNNVPLFDIWQQYFRQHQPSALIIWGENDRFFVEAGARAYQKDLKDTEVHLVNSGHFALEEFHREIAQHITHFLSKRNLK
ncbi:MAG: alpha/beta hydrolase [Microscillaceae bacterium]|nr:alpha/beta hydrolase [Microscillaceae bacterium]